MKRFIISAILMGFVTVATAAKAPRCVKWTWYNIGAVQKSVCLAWEKR